MPRQGNLVFPEHILNRATKNFSQENKLGEGGCGEVFKGNLSGIPVAVKRLSRDTLATAAHLEAEIVILSKYHFPPSLDT